MDLDAAFTTLVLVAPKVLQSQVANDVRKASTELRDQLGQNALESPTQPIVKGPVPSTIAAESCKMQDANAQHEQNATPAVPDTTGGQLNI